MLTLLDFWLIIFSVCTNSQMMLLSQQLTLLQLIILATGTDGKPSNTVYQFPPFITAAEGESVTLNCALDFDGNLTPVGAAYWTRGKPDGYKLDNSPFYEARLERSDSDSFANNRIFINISELIEKDSDTYYCRVSLMGTGMRDGNGTKLEVKRKMQEENSGKPDLILGLKSALTLLGITAVLLIFGLIWQSIVIRRLKRHHSEINTKHATANLQPMTQAQSNLGSDEDVSLHYTKVDIKQQRKAKAMNCETCHVEYATIS